MRLHLRNAEQRGLPRLQRAAYQVSHTKRREAQAASCRIPGTPYPKLGSAVRRISKPIEGFSRTRGRTCAANHYEYDISDILPIRDQPSLPASYAMFPDLLIARKRREWHRVIHAPTGIGRLSYPLVPGTSQLKVGVGVRAAARSWGSCRSPPGRSLQPGSRDRCGDRRGWHPAAAPAA